MLCLQTFVSFHHNFGLTNFWRNFGQFVHDVKRPLLGAPLQPTTFERSRSPWNVWSSWQHAIAKWRSWDLRNSILCCVLRDLNLRPKHQIQIGKTGQVELLTPSNIHMFTFNQDPSSPFQLPWTDPYRIRTQMKQTLNFSTLLSAKSNLIDQLSLGPAPDVNEVAFQASHFQLCCKSCRTRRHRSVETKAWFSLLHRKRPERSSHFKAIKYFCDGCHEKLRDNAFLQPTRDLKTVDFSARLASRRLSKRRMLVIVRWRIRRIF